MATPKRPATPQQQPAPKASPPAPKPKTKEQIQEETAWGMELGPETRGYRDGERGARLGMFAARMNTPSGRKMAAEMAEAVGNGMKNVLQGCKNLARKAKDKFDEFERVDNLYWQSRQPSQSGGPGGPGQRITQGRIDQSKVVREHQTANQAGKLKNTNPAHTGAPIRGERGNLKI